MGVLAEIRRSVLGPRVAAVGCSGFLTEEGLSRAEATVTAGRPEGLLDIGCGDGRLGLYLAGASGCRRLLGIDSEPRRIAVARAHPFPHGVRARFDCRSFEVPPRRRARSWCAGVALDSLYLAARLNAALACAARQLRPGARLWATAYVGETEEGGVQGRTLATWRVAWVRAGFRVEEVFDGTQEWRDNAARLHRMRLDQSARVMAELGASAGSQAIAISRRMLGVDGRRSFLADASRAEFTVVRDGRDRPVDQVEAEP